MAGAAIIAVGQKTEHAQLFGGQHAIRDRNPQHVGVKLKVEAVLQAQRLELVFAQLAGKAARHLIAKLLGACINERLIMGVIGVHWGYP